MNGRFPSPAHVSTRPGIVPGQHRLAAAAVVSCLLHASLLVAPYLGTTDRGHPIVAARDWTSPRPFTASLKAAAQPEPEPVGESVTPVATTEGVGMLPFSAPAYYPTNQLSKRPQPLGSADLEAPEISMIAAAGQMILKLWIDESGEVVDVEVEKTELPEVFSRSAVAAFKRLRFVPGERGGVRVGSVMRIEVNYDDRRIAAP
ncbi:MAG: TonB family protein [Sterolibacterium sp.]|jgi:TonB family protein